MPELQVWTVDPLTKVLPTDRRESSAPKPIVIEAARNEVESGQVAVRSTKGVTVHALVSPLVHADGDVRIDRVRVCPVGYIRIDPKTLPKTDPRSRRRNVILVPDILTGSPEVRLERGRAQAMWITVEVPASARPGSYRGELTLSTARETVSVPIDLTVYPAAVPAKRTLYLAQWLAADGPLARHIPGAIYPREVFWTTMRSIARNMGAHRQNVLRMPFGPSIDGPIAATPTGIDGLAFNFGGFDRLVELFIEHGAADLIAGRHLAARGPDGTGGLAVKGLLNVGGCLAAVDLKVDSPECRNFFFHYLTALHRHLQFKGWLDRYVQHICDEPSEDDLPVYEALVRQVRERMPGVRIIESVLSTRLSDQVDIRVPRLDHFVDCLRPYQDRQRAGGEVWFYTSGDLGDRYPNHFLDRSLLDVRIIQWMNFAFKATGYVHGGYNAWEVENPLKPDGADGPAGGRWIVYPGQDGVLDSIRHEATRDGVEDYELLQALYSHHPRQALTLAKSVVKTGTKYTTSINTFRRARRRLLELASQ